MNKFQAAKNQYGTVDLSRWLLPDGEFLGVSDYEDHRIVGEFCNDTWLEFIDDGAMSLHYDDHCGYLWIRTSGITIRQMQAFRELFENELLRVRNLKVDVYEGTNYQEEILIDDPELAQLYLTDQIAYQISMSEREDQ